MFTGIITHTAKITKHQQNEQGLTLTFVRPSSWNDIELGESIATDGVCLTVAAIHSSSYECFLMPETLDKTSFGTHVPSAVNLERAMRMGDKLGGHIVQGHVDGVGRIEEINRTNGHDVTISFPAAAKKYVIYKGSITVNGVSLTVVKTHDNQLTVSLIPHTLEHTTLHLLQKGDPVNLEFDMIGKYIVRNLELRSGSDRQSS